MRRRSVLSGAPSGRTRGPVPGRAERSEPPAHELERLVPVGTVEGAGEPERRVIPISAVVPPVRCSVCGFARYGLVWACFGGQWLWACVDCNGGRAS